MDISSKRYRVILTSPSALKVGARRGWKDPEYHMLIRDDVQECASGKPPVHLGLIYTVEVNAEHIVEAIHKATSYARHVTDQVSVVHGAVLDYPTPQFSIDIDPAWSHRELAQVLYNVPILQQPRRNYDNAIYSDFYKYLDTLRQNHPESAMRVDRALHYLRNSYLEHDPIDKFEDAWVALEAVNPLIREKYSQPTTYQRECPKCRKGLSCQACNAPIREPDNASGIAYIVTELLGEERPVAKRLRKKRIDIVHARSNFSTVLKDIGQDARLAQRAVVAGVLDILGVPKGQQSSFLREILPVVGAPQVIVSALLRDFPVAAIGTQAKYPALYLQVCQTWVPNRQEAHAGEIRPLAAKLNIGIRNFTGDWDLLELHSLLEFDPEENAPLTELILAKCLIPDIGA